MSENNLNLINRPKRTNQTIDNSVRKLIIDKMNIGFTAKDLSAVYEVKANTIIKMYAKYLKTGSVDKAKTGHRKPILSNEQKELICDWIDDNCSLTLKQIRDKCLVEFEDIEHLSENTIQNALKDFHYSFKRITLVPEVRNSPEVIEKRFQYAIKYNQIMIEKEKLFFIDEFGTTVTSRARYGRSARNSPAYKRVSAIRSRNYSICAAMGENSLFFFEIQDKPYNSEHFFGFLNQLFVYLNDNEINGANLVMDNVRFHKTEEVRNLIQAHGHYAVFLAPYSPFLNPIEELFSQWKRSIRAKEATNEDLLYEAIHNSSLDISSQNCYNYIKHMERYLTKCLNREIINN